MADEPHPPQEQARSVALCEDLTLAELGADARRALDATADALRDAGLEVVEVELPEAALIRPAFNAIQAAEALAEHRRLGLYPERVEEYGPALIRRLVAAKRVGGGAGGGRARPREGARGLCPPVRAGRPAADACFGCPARGAGGEGRPAAEFRERVLPFTCPQDLAGLPACAVPAGRDAAGLPVGVQISGPQGADRRVLEAARAVSERL